MPGSVLSRLMPKVISAKSHSIIDYIHAGTNLAMGVVFLRRERRASIAAFALGGGVLANALMTDYPLGVFRLYSFRTHGILDYGVAAATAAMPNLLRMEDGVARRYFQLQGSGESAIAGLTDYSDRTGAHRRRKPSRRAA